MIEIDSECKPWHVFFESPMILVYVKDWILTPKLHHIKIYGGQFYASLNKSTKQISDKPIYRI